VDLRLLTSDSFLRRQRCKVTNRELGGGHRFSDYDSALRGTLISPFFSPFICALIKIIMSSSRGYFRFPDLGRYHTAIMCYWGSHQDGSISPKKTQAKVVAHSSVFYSPCVHYSLVDSFSFGDTWFCNRSTTPGSMINLRYALCRGRRHILYLL
jgi:hypothetical protein